MTGIYVHIPFCESKCIYCDFASFVKDDDIKEKYFKFLLNEISSSQYKGRKVDTIFVGGGTPSCVKSDYIANILKTIKENFIVEENAEVTIECNPNSISEEKLKKYLDSGINRISFGVQSLHDDALKVIGRLHNRKQALSAIEMAKKVGFKNINADLMLGLPKASIDKVIEDTKCLIECGVTHISAYMLQIEEKTPLAKMVEENPKFVLSDDETVEIYENLTKFLEKNGFLRYEISNFALSGAESKHNLKYWSGEDYIGFGLASHSLIDGKRIANSRDMEEYFKGIKKIDELSINEKIEEKIMLGLRCKLGFNLDELLTLGHDIEQNENYKDFLKRGILQKEKNTIKLNPEYYGVNNFIIVSLLPNV